MPARSVIALVFVVACTGTSTPPHVDALARQTDAPAATDAKVYMDAAKVFMDAAPNACTGQLYDSCNPAASNCTGSETCKTFTGSGFSVCTQTCSTTNPCPSQNGAAVACNNMGICKPSAPNTDCTAP